MRTQRLATVLATVVLAIDAAGCSAGSPSILPSFSTPPTADQVMQQLAAKVPSAKLGIVYTAENDPNHLLGRPNGYTSKISFTDSRVDKKRVEGQASDAVDAGGSVEVYQDADGAARRAKYIQDLQKAAPILGTEYGYLEGPVLVRVSGNLTPTQAAEYKTALDAS
jgi:hypothetical protein